MRNGIFKLWAAVLAVMLVIVSLAGCADTANNISADASSTGSDTSGTVSETSEVSAVPDANDIVILYTNDVHCGIDSDIGYAGLYSYMESVKAKTPNVLLVDCGDAVQGDFIGTVSNGEYITDIMNHVGYDYAVLGNHEFDYGMEQLSKLIDKSEAKYLCCNVTYTGESENALSATKPYDIVDYGNAKVALIGVSTPHSVTSSTPAYFMEDGEFVYNFASGDDGKLLAECVQKNVDECKALGADYVVLLTHLGDASEAEPFSSVELLNKTSGIDACLDGHSHSVISCRVEKNKDGKDVLLSSTGTKLANIGQLIITENGIVSAGLISDYNQKDESVTAYIEGIKTNYTEQMQKSVATTDITLSCSDDNGIRIVRTRETTIGDFCADAYRAVLGADIAFVNGGGIRADIPAGNITYADMLAVHPFGNMLCVVKATGQEILDCLEMSSRNTVSAISEDDRAVGENGEFQQVSGLKYTIDTSVASTVTVDDNGMFSAVSGERRVKDVYVLGSDGEYRPIDANATYTLASNNYIIKNNGGGLNMFSDNELLVDEGIVDYQALIDYITKTLDGKLGDKYSKTDGRITVK